MTPRATFALLPGELRPLSRGQKLGKVALGLFGAVLIVAFYGQGLIWTAAGGAVFWCAMAYEARQRWVAHRRAARLLEVLAELGRKERGMILAERANVPRFAVYGILGHLADEGLVVRSPESVTNEAGELRHIFYYEITSEGRAVVGAAVSRVAETEPPARRESGSPAPRPDVVRRRRTRPGGSSEPPAAA